MSLNSTPRAERYHIAFFGNRNAGKSSLLNAVANQDLAVVSPVLGTTTDPVYKSMEILPIGPCVLIDTPGFDDEGTLGEMRIKKTRDVLGKADAAVLVIDGLTGRSEKDDELISIFQERKIPYIVVYNKEDEVSERKDGLFYVSAKNKSHIDELRIKLSELKAEKDERHLVSDLILPHSLIVLVIPIDSSAPKGRLILPQQQVIRDILDSGSSVIASRDVELERTLEEMKREPDLVITDSQVFAPVSKIVPQSIPLTSFSILMARYKGFLEEAVKGVSRIKDLKEGDDILIAEGCTHHRQCEDIGSVKIPSWLRKFTGKDFNFDFSSGSGFPDDLSKYDLIIHCGACMLNNREVLSRMERAIKQQIPFTNYGIAISYMNGILKRSLEIFPDLAGIL